MAGTSCQLEFYSIFEDVNSHLLNISIERNVLLSEIIK